MNKLTLDIPAIDVIRGFSSLIKFQRKMHNLSRNDISGITGISHSTIRRIESGDIQVGIFFYMRYLDVFGMADKLIEAAMDIPSDRDKIKRLRNELNQKRNAKRQENNDLGWTESIQKSILESRQARDEAKALRLARKNHKI